MARIKDVAALAGVNRSTVSRIINGEGKFKEETRKKVEQAMAELNYRPSAIARSLATSSSNMMGLLVTYYTGGFFGAMMEQVQSELDLHAKFLITAQGHHSKQGERDAIERFHDLRCDGYILHSRHLSDDDLVELAKQHPPFVLLDRVVPSLEERCIGFNHHTASSMAVTHLLQQNHRLIGCITGPTCRENSLQRKQGYLDTMSQAGIVVNESWCEEGNYGARSGYEATEKLLERHPELTAIFSCSEEMTVGAMQYLHEQGLKVPEDISIVSFDSVERCKELYPAVTSVCFPINDMAQSAVQVLMDLLAGNGKKHTHEFTPQLVVGKADRYLS
ncbi:LacI family DNA-binding transcriptional regulator [Vibrio panuliri]|uniref:LacI family transcriptional regulator n=1 Tax=Vibrio panuliri TaxID=1381081 RepID=A0ABX3FBM3_9VIBR|nr:LacI family DNA-binding transcriptional regulator [Vibrio panuliri]KAB1459757.1 LacI family transcriptional regulator [Vibrio panuliri]OLQ86532.1 LacI family transcriptional regulator [Vibrio panuliri]